MKTYTSTLIIIFSLVFTSFFLGSCKKSVKDNPIEGTNWEIKTSGYYQGEIRFYNYNYIINTPYKIGFYHLDGQSLSFEISGIAINDTEPSNYRFDGILNSDFTEMRGEATCIENCDALSDGTFTATRKSKDQ